MTSPEPTPVELMAIIGLLIVENDARREHSGAICLSWGRRTYDPDEIERGKQLETKVFVNPGGCLVAKVES